MYSFVFSMLRNASSVAVRIPFGRRVASLAKSMSVDTPRRVPVVLKTFWMSRCGPRGKDWMKKKSAEQKRMLRLVLTFGGNGLGEGRVR